MYSYIYVSVCYLKIVSLISINVKEICHLELRSYLVSKSGKWRIQTTDGGKILCKCPIVKYIFCMGNYLIFVSIYWNWLFTLSHKLTILLVVDNVDKLLHNQHKRHILVWWDDRNIQRDAWSDHSSSVFHSLRKYLWRINSFRSFRYCVIFT